MILELNEYVRTKNGIIAKVIGVQSGGIEKYFFDKEVHNLFNYLNGLAVENVVIKHSFDIIDLIEEGDYVNGKKVLDNVINAFLEVSSSNLGNNRIFARMIKSIVTKEQFKSMEYEVK